SFRNRLHAFTDSRLRERGKLLDSEPFKKLMDLQIEARHRFVASLDELHGLKRITTDLEKVVRRADVHATEDLPPDREQRPFDLRARFGHAALRFGQGISQRSQGAMVHL